MVRQKYRGKEKYCGKENILMVRRNCDYSKEKVSANSSLSTSIEVVERINK